MLVKLLVTGPGLCLGQPGGSDITGTVTGVWLSVWPRPSACGECGHTSDSKPEASEELKLLHTMERARVLGDPQAPKAYRVTVG